MSTCSSCGHELLAEAKFCPSCGTKVTGGVSLEDSLLGRTLNGKYRLLSVIGSGSMGTVYLGEHVGLQKKVALKILRPDLEVSEEILQRFQREGIAAGKFSHPNAIQIFDFDRADDRVFYLAMEFVEGVNLKQFLIEEETLSHLQAVDLVRQVLSALAEAHDNGIVHRDLKPENIMVLRGADGELTVKVLDFGLSKLIHFPLGASMQTQPGRIMGTPLYMAPEQGLGDEVDHRSDLYAVGLILYELISGAPPFRGESLTELLTKQLTQTAPALSDSHPDLEIPGALDELVERAMQKKKEDRFQSAAEMLDALDAISLDGAGVRPRRPAPASSASTVLAKTKVEATSRPSGKRRWPLVAGAAAVVVVLAVAAGAAWRYGGDGIPGGSVARASLKSPEQRTEQETRYVGLLEESRRNLMLGETDIALDKVVEAQSLACRDSEAFLVRALVYRARGDRDAALADFREALRVDPSYAQAKCGVGWIELDERDLENALESFTKAAEFDPTLADAFAGEGAVRFLRRDRAAARELLEEAIDLDSEHARASHYLGQLLMEEGDEEGAIEAFVRAKRNDPGSWRVVADLARAYLATDRPGDAEVQLEEALRLEPAALEPITDLGALLVDGQRHQEAIELLETPVRRHPDWVEPRVLLACALVAEGQRSKAIAALQLAVDLDGGDSRVRTLLGSLYQQEGQLEPALEQYDAAIRIDKYLAPPHFNKGLALFALERYPEALIELERALELDPEDAFTHLTLGILRMEYVGGPERAIEHFETYKGLGGSDERVPGWIARLRGGQR